MKNEVQNTKKKRFNLELEKLPEFLFFISIFILVVFTSYWQIEFSYIKLNLVNYLLYFVVAFMIYIRLIYLLFKVKSDIANLKLSGYILLLILFSTIYLINRDLNIGIVFLYGALLLFIRDTKKILNIFLKAVVCAVTIVVVMSILNFFPMHLNDSLVMGFRNTNTFGYYLGLITVLNWTINWEKISFKNVIILLINTIIILVIEDNTALFVILFLIFFKVLFKIENFKKILKSNFLSIVISCLPFFITYLSYILCVNYSKNSAWLLSLNNKLSARLWMWNYYYNSYPISKFGNVLAENSQGTLVFPLDNAFLNTIFLNGLVTYFIFTIILAYATFKIIKNNRYDLLCLFLVYIFSGFTENQLFIFYQCPVMLLAVYMIGYRKEFESEKKM